MIRQPGTPIRRFGLQRWTKGDQRMCYSAMVWASYHKYVKLFGAKLSI